MDNVQQSPLEPQAGVTGNPSIQPQGQPALLGAPALLKEAWSLFQARMSTFLGITLVMFVPAIATMIIVGLSTGAETPTNLNGLLGSGLAIPFIVGLVIVAFLGILLQLWGSVALFYAIKDSQEQIGVMESYRRGRSKILSYLWVSTLAGFIVMGGLLLFVVPGVIFSVWFSLALCVLVAEDLKGTDALLKSREYVRGLWSVVFWRFLFIGALTFIVAIVSTFLLSFLNMPLVEQIGDQLINLLFAPLGFSYLFLLYRNVKSVKGAIVFAPTRKQKGVFIGIGIFGILLIPVLFTIIGIVFASLGFAEEKARDAFKKGELSRVQAALELYLAERGNYPSSLDELPKEYQPKVPEGQNADTLYQYERPKDSAYKLCVALEASEKEECVTSGV